MSAEVPPTRPAGDRWRTYVVYYLLWLVLFSVVEGAGRQTCRMPTAKWIAAGADARDRNMRAWFRDRANDCLDRTPWYAYSMGTLFTLGLLAPFGVVWVVRKRIMSVAMAHPVFMIKTAALLYGGVFVAALGVSLGSMEAVRWLYDWAS